MQLLVPHPSLKLQFLFLFIFFIFSQTDVTALFSLAGKEQPQFHIFRKLSQDPVQTAMPSADTPMQLTLLS